MNEPQTHLPPPPSRWSSLLLGLVILFSGIAIGAGGMIVFGQDLVLRRDRDPGSHVQRMVERMTGDLGLTPEQQEQVDELFHRHFEAMHEMMREIQPRMRERFNRLDEEVAEVLTPEQREIWARETQEFRDRMDRRFDRPREGRPGGGQARGGERRGGPAGHERRPG